MRYSFRLAELLNYNPEPGKRPGVIKAIVDSTGLDRHQVASLLKNDVKAIPLSALSQLCDYLAENGFAAADDLPGALFAVEPEELRELLAKRKMLELCIGVRASDSKDLHGALVTASDSVIVGELLSGVSSIGMTTETSLDEEDAEEAAAARTTRQNLRQSLVWSPGQPADVRGRADEVYDAFDESRGDKALVCLGSIKSNPVVELMLASFFKAEPFVSQDDVASPSKRSIPFMLRYRREDPVFKSCAGGVRLAKSVEAEQPGIYYETKTGDWACCPWTETDRDAALVFYVYRESLGRLEMTLGGFSGRATRLLARALWSSAYEFWPPCFNDNGTHIGAYVVSFKIDPAGDHGDVLRTDLAAETTVIPLDEEVLALRFGE